MIKPSLIRKISTATAIVIPLLLNTVSAAPDAKNKRIFDHWTAEKMANAIPRDLVVDQRGLGYIRKADGSLSPHGHSKLAQLSAKYNSNNNKPTPFAKPGTGDSAGPDVAPIEPASGSTIGDSQRFAITATDPSGVRSVSIVITFPAGNTQSFTASNSTGDVWENTLSGFTTSSGWSWHVVAKDNSGGRGNTTTSAAWSFNVDTNGGGEPPPPGGGDSVANSQWTAGGDVQTAVGRIFFEMPTNNRLKRWAGYVCSGTVTTDGTSGRSVIITASHCVYDDANKAFARNVLFIPNQAGGGSGTDTNCGNDPIGCWSPAFGVVDINWTTNTFPNNIPWDYAYYVVNDTGAHSGASASSDALDVATNPLAVDFNEPFFNDGNPSANSNDFTHGLGYSYSDDPNFMYCADDLTTEGDANWWIPICGLSGGSSGGPWVQPMNTSNGSGPIISVNSWGYTDGSPGMAGPILSGTSAFCLYVEAKGIDFGAVSTADGSAGVAVDYCP